LNYTIFAKNENSIETAVVSVRASTAAVLSTSRRKL